MKKIKSLLAAATILTGSAMFAQISDPVTLNVELQDIQSLTVNSAQEIVTLNLATVTDYQTGVNQTQNDHIAVVSSFDYDITASASQDLTKTGETNTIPVSTVSLQASAGTGASGTTFPAVTFAAPLTAINIVTGASADLDANYNIDYALSGGVEYLNQPTGTYTTIITYTLVPQ